MVLNGINATMVFQAVVVFITATFETIILDGEAGLLTAPLHLHEMRQTCWHGSIGVLIDKHAPPG